MERRTNKYCLTYGKYKYIRTNLLHMAYIYNNNVISYSLTNNTYKYVQHLLHIMYIHTNSVNE